MKHLILSLLLTATLTGMAQDLENVTVDGKSRTMMVYAPQNLPSANAPLVISLHGFNQNAAYQRDQTHWNECADSAKFVVVYPNAIDTWWDVYGTSDIVFLDWIIDKMYDRYKIDRNRVYITGFSLGSMMTYHCMEHLADKVAAFGPVSGVRFDNKAPYSPRRVPFIHTHGTADDVFKWTGDPGHQAGGYPYIPDYVESWATYEGLTEKEVVAPYPSTKANSNATLTTWRSSDPNDKVEVALLAIKDKGHWHSEDINGGVSTTQEIWKFCKRYSLGPSAPVIVNMEPEDMSFDLGDDMRTYTLTLTDVADVASVKAQLTGAGQSIDLQLQEKENSSTLTFVVPADAKLSDGEYKLSITDIKNPEGGDGASYKFSYTYGFFEPGDELQVDTLFVTNWADMEEALGEGIPYGWHRVNSNANGSNDTRESGEANVTGARLKYFHEGGDFDAGFYLSARDYNRCDFSYGQYSDYPLSLQPGKYSVKFKSTYWNQSAKDAEVTFGVSVAPKSNVDNKLMSAEMATTGCLEESTGAKVTKSTSHDYCFEIEEGGDYVLNFSMTRGWNAVILAEPMITTYPCAADLYKGEFQRMYARAVKAYGYTENVEDASIKKARKRIKNYIDKYADLVSTAPSVYIKAMESMGQYLETLEAYLATSGIPLVTNSNDEVSCQYYTIDGRLAQNPQSGIYVKLTRHSNGATTASKVYLR